MDKSISFEISEDGLNVLVNGVRVLEISEVSDENVVNLFLRGNIFISESTVPGDIKWEILVPRNGDTFCVTCGNINPKSSGHIPHDFRTNPEPEFVTVCQKCQTPVCGYCCSICDNCGEIMCENCCQGIDNLPYCTDCAEDVKVKLS